MKTKFFLTAILLAFGFATVLNGQVIGYWRFDEQAPGAVTDTNSGAILDQSGNGYNGTAATPMNYVTGSSAYGGTAALEFTLNPDNVVVPDPSGVFNFTPGQSFTLEALIRTTDSGQSGVGSILAKQGADPGEWWWRISGGKQQFWLADGTSHYSVNGKVSLNDGEWHHIAAVYDGSAQELRVYVDYVADASAPAPFTSSDVIGNSKDLWIGAFQAGNRQFDGDMDFARISAGALDPTQFVPPVTYIANLSPADNASYVSPAGGASFTVESPTVGVAASNIFVGVNGADISSEVTITGTDAEHTVMLPALDANEYYQVAISVTDNDSNSVSQSWTFNTFVNGIFTIEAEDYNFNGGQFIDNPELSSVDGESNYLDRIGIEGIDYHQTAAPAQDQYRIGDQVGTAITSDTLRQEYLDAEVTDPGVADYMVRDNVNSEWLNYTRTFPAATYRVYLRLAKPGTVPVVMQLDEVTAGSTSSSQTLAPIGFFRHEPTGSDSKYEFVPLTDALGNEIAVPLNGERTIRLTMLSGAGNVNLNYIVFVPENGSQAPFLASVSPAANAGNEASDASIEAVVHNGDTTVGTDSVQLKLDDAEVTPVVTPTTSGADIAYSPSVMTTGLHTATLIFTDSATTSTTNQWQFYVANQAVRGYWKFNEEAPGNFASTNTGAILDASGNNRNGTVNVDSMQYVAGSANYSSTPALQFTFGPDHIVVPDPSGNFNFTNSFTIEAIIRTTNTTTTSAAVLAKNGTGDGEGEYWWRVPGLSGGRQRFGVNNQLFVPGTNALNDGLWHHVAVVYDQSAGEVRLYADYALDGSAPASFDTMIGRPADLFIGSFVNGGSDFAGDIDSLRISNGALTPDQFIQPSVALAPILKSVLPADGALNVAPEPAIRAEFQNRDTSVALSSLKLVVDGVDVTGNSTTAEDAGVASIAYTPASPLAAGLHTATAMFSDTAEPANSGTNNWTFTVINSIPVLGFYQFNEKASGELADTNAGAILDSSGSDHNATASASLPYVDGSPDFDGMSALLFTVGGGHVAIPDVDVGAFSFADDQSFTLEAVINTVNIGQSSVGSIICKQGASPGEYWWRINSDGTQQFYVNDGTGAKNVKGAAVLNDGLWHHVAAVYDATAQQVRVYVDYALDGSPAAAVYTSTTNVIGNNKDVWIGAFQAGNRQFDGSMDAVRISAAALDPSWFVPLGAVVPQFKLTNVGIASGEISFSFDTETGKSYVIQSAGDPGASWNDEETIPGDGTTKTVSYPMSAAQQFFRVNVQ